MFIFGLSIIVCSLSIYLSVYQSSSVCYLSIYLFITYCRGEIGLMSRVFANGPGDRGSIPKIQKLLVAKIQKMVLDAALLSTHHYKLRIKGKVEQS